MSELAHLISRHTKDPVTITAIPNLLISRVEVATECRPVLYEPAFCVVAQGRKRVLLGKDEFLYDADTYLVTSISVPVRSQVLEAPCLSLGFRLDLKRVTSLILEMPKDGAFAKAGKGMDVAPLTRELRDALLRLLRLLDQPARISILAPGIEREIYYHLLLGPHGNTLRQMAAPDQPLSLIKNALDAIQHNFDRPWRVEELAEISQMSTTSFYRHFRTITGMSPLQYLKDLRLNEARRLLLANTSVTLVSSQVGYESPSQFSREYRRLFGVPPSEDAAKLRETVSSGQL